MESNSKPLVPADGPELDLYTIPVSSSWFSWDSIHETERRELGEFFDNSSYTRSPKIYKEYRDFIINKYREESSRRLTFTEVRKSLVGDVCLLRKVFNFLEKWGLINFNGPSSSDSPADEAVGSDGCGWKVKAEDGPPVGVKVVAAPNSVKPLVPPLPPALGNPDLVGNGNGFKLPPLASYSDVFADLAKGEGLACRNCKESCNSKYYVCTMDNSIMCVKCFENEVFGENKSANDYKLLDHTERGSELGASWTEAETLLLFESVLKHGDDWELVAENVKTKTKLECISRLIEMPFGELMFGAHGKVSNKGTIVVVSDHVEEVKPASKEPQESKGSDDPHPGDVTNEDPVNVSNVEEVKPASVEPEESKRPDDNHLDQAICTEQNGEAESEERPLKKRKTDSLDPPDKPLMEQVAYISKMSGPEVQFAAMNGAVSALSDGNPFMADIFCVEKDNAPHELRSGDLNTEIEREIGTVEDSESNQAPGPSGANRTSPPKDTIPVILRMRAGVATALGAAAAHARLLADHEEREMEQLVATIIDTQLKKIHSKAKHFDRLESIMEKEYVQLMELKESIIAERMDILRKTFSAGISR